MATISELVDRFFGEERPIGIVLDETVVLAQAIAAVNFHSGYADLAEHLAIPIVEPAPEPPTPYPAITANTNLTVCEWALIKPLFLLYIERETAPYHAASRQMGVEMFSRELSEVSGDIAQMELEYPHKAFYQPITTI